MSDLVERLRQRASDLEAHPMDWDLLIDAATRIAYLERREVEAREWIKAALNMVEGDGMPPNWDGMRAWLAGTAPQGQGE